MAPRNKRGDDYSEAEIQDRLRRTLAGAFSGPPTPLKAIPKRSGESRRLAKKAASSAAAANGKSGRPKP